MLSRILGQICPGTGPAAIMNANCVITRVSRSPRNGHFSARGVTSAFRSLAEIKV